MACRDSSTQISTEQTIQPRIHAKSANAENQLLAASSGSKPTAKAFPRHRSMACRDSSTQISAHHTIQPRSHAKNANAEEQRPYSFFTNSVLFGLEEETQGSSGSPLVKPASSL